MEFFSQKNQYKLIKKEINFAIQRVLDRGIFIGGKELKECEKEIAKFCGTKYAIGVNSGTDALFLSLKVLGIGEGDEIITTPFTFISTASVIANIGAKPVFIDIDIKTFNIDSAKIEEKITSKTKAIIPVHLFGQMANMDEIMKIAKKHKLFVVEDAAQAIGAEYKNKKAGSIGNLGCFSFFPTKNLGAYGDGGMIVTNSKKLSDKIQLLKNHGSSPQEKYKNLSLGINSRLDTIQATILRVKLKYLKKWNRERRKNAEYYNKKLKEVKNIKIPTIASHRMHIFHQYTLQVETRDRLKKYLEKKKILTMIYYPLPLHLQPVFEYLEYKKGDFFKAEKIAKQVLSLPIYPGLTRMKQDYVIQKIKSFYERRE